LIDRWIDRQIDRQTELLADKWICKVVWLTDWHTNCWFMGWDYCID